jgi:16S rRNA (uracil1498-N3)-methyltransferase
MNLILLFPADFILNTNRVRLTGRRHTHVMSVHKAGVGDELCVGMLDAKIGTGKITALDKDKLEMEVALERDPPAGLPVTLIMALPRPPMLRRTLFAATSMGVKRIYLINSFRVEKTFWQSHALREEDIRDQLVLGLEQARDTRLPEVFLRPKFKPFVEDELPQLAAGTLPLVAHPGSVTSCPRGVDRPVTLVIGPEGGFIPYEIEKFLELGFNAVGLGERILRFETVVPAILGRLF